MTTLRPRCIFATVHRHRAADTPANTPADGPVIGETCDYCGSPSLRWRKCKLICDNCRQINKSCADL